MWIGFAAGGGAAGCQRSQHDSFETHRSMASSVLSSIQELQRRRAAIEASQDVLAMLNELKFLRPPPVPEPEPALAPEPEPAATMTTARTNAVDAAMTAPVGPPQLQGIIQHPREPLAILGGRTVGVGERVGGYGVHRVEADRVVLLSPEGTIVELRLHEGASPSP